MNTCENDHLILGIALGTFWGGVAAAGKLRAEVAQRAGVGVMGSTAMVAALEKFGAPKLASLTPHQPRGDETVPAYFWRGRPDKEWVRPTWSEL